MTVSCLAGSNRSKGDALSWGDLKIYAGIVAIRSVGGPTAPHGPGGVRDISVGMAKTEDLTAANTAAAGPTLAADADCQCRRASADASTIVGPTPAADTKATTTTTTTVCRTHHNLKALHLNISRLRLSAPNARMQVNFEF